jgi:hypothetical protein
MKNYVGFAVLTAVAMKRFFFWDITLWRYLTPALHAAFLLG